MSFTTSLRLPTVAREVQQDGGSGSMWSNVNNALLADGSYATCLLPDGSTYTPTSTENDAGQVLPAAIFLNAFNFSAELPANAVVKGITVHTVLFSDYIESDQDIFYTLQFYNAPGVVLTLNDPYFLFQGEDITVPVGDTSVRTVGGVSDVWQPEPRLVIDGMYLFSTDGVTHGYEVMTSEVDPFAYDFNYVAPNLLIQPTTQGYTTAIMDAAGQPLDYTGLVGKTITLTVPSIGDFTLTGQAGAVTPGDATFQAAIGNDETENSITNQFIAYSNGFGNVADYVSITAFRDIIWQWTPFDVGTETNLYRLTTNADPSALLWPNDGYFSGGLDLNPDASTMASSTAANLINTVSMAPIHARVDGGSSVSGIEITNTLSHLTLAHSVPASVFRNTNFGILLLFNPADGSTGDPLLYPEINDDVQKLDYVKVSLTYDLVGGGLLTLGVS